MKLILVMLMAAAVCSIVACFNRATTDTSFKRLDSIGTLNWISAAVACMVAVAIFVVLTAAA